MLGDCSPLLCRLVSEAHAQLSAFSLKGAVSPACGMLERDGGCAELDVTCFVISLKSCEWNMLLLSPR